MVSVIPQNDSQSRLILDLLRNYNVRVRPVLVYSKSVRVTLTLKPYQILDVVRTSDSLNQSKKCQNKNRNSVVMRNGS